ncbi:cytochrome P450 711A1-like [Cryptomeria japonica]|uniref:cytochrome P450 711A1-like n=1 Tax=Cryptomeria japonica TaxID=3369 RepID=UPI0027DA172C|nr:cytochrome P450 711A1-like [Cryptomeria japonica]
MSGLRFNSGRQPLVIVAVAELCREAGIKKFKFLCINYHLSTKVEKEDINFLELLLKVATDIIGEAAFGERFDLTKSTSKSTSVDPVQEEVSKFVKRNVYSTSSLKMDLTGTFSIIIGLDYISSLTYEHLLASSSTTSFTLSMVLYLLSAHPHLKKKFLQEIDAFGAPGKNPTAQDLHKFPYLS